MTNFGNRCNVATVLLMLCLFPIITKSQAILTPEKPTFYLHVDFAQIVQKKSTLQCQGKTNFPDGTILQGTLNRNMQGESCKIASSFNMVKDGKFQMVFGPFHKKLFPGNYRIVVFYSPIFQSEQSFFSLAFAMVGAIAAHQCLTKSLAEASFTKAIYHIHLGGQEEYTRVFMDERQWITKCLAETKRCFDTSEHHFQIAKHRNGLDDWFQFRHEREKWIRSLRIPLKKEQDEYLYSFFPRTFVHLHELVNLVEMFNEAVEMNLRGDDEKYLQYRADQFRSLYPTAWRYFQYDAIALAPQELKFGMLRDEIVTLSKYCTDRSQSSSSLPNRPGRERQMLCYLVSIRKIYNNLQIFSESPDTFIEQSNQCLLELKGIMHELECSESGVSGTLPSYRSGTQRGETIPYRICHALLEEWKSKASSKFPMGETSKDSRAFQRIWEEALECYNMKKILPISISMELELLQEQLAQLRSQVQQTEYAQDWEEKLKEWTVELLQRQNLNCQLLSLLPESNHRVFAEYICLCAYMINSYDIIGQFWQGTIQPQIANRSLLQAEEQLARVKRILDETTKAFGQ